jgi:hypothetical protein
VECPIVLRPFGPVRHRLFLFPTGVQQQARAGANHGPGEKGNGTVGATARRARERARGTSRYGTTRPRGRLATGAAHPGMFQHRTAAGFVVFFD